MKKQVKDNIAVISAVVLLTFGICLTVAGFFVPPLGIIDNSVLWVLGQSLIYSKRTQKALHRTITTIKQQ